MLILDFLLISCSIFATARKYTVTYSFALPGESKNGTVELKSFSLLVAADDTDNSYTYSSSPTADTINITRQCL